MKRRPPRVHEFSEAADHNEPAIVRYCGDPAEFERLAAEWMAERERTRASWNDVPPPMRVLPPEPALWRWVPSGDMPFLRRAQKPGPGVWTGALLRLEQDGCSLCYRARGQHDEGCLNEDIVGLATVQLGARHGHGPLSHNWVHAVRSRARRPATPERPGQLGGTPGPTLCEIDRFGPEAPGFSVGGGSWSPREKYVGCYLCGIRARDEFPGVPISGMREFAETFARDTGVPLAEHLAQPRKPAAPATALTV